jgi:hypothetical protein
MYLLFLFKIITVRSDHFKVLRPFSLFRRKTVIELAAIERVLIRVSIGANSIVVFTRSGEEVPFSVGISRFELRRLRDALVARGIRVDDFV